MLADATEPPLQAELFDGFGAYPHDFTTDFILSLDENCWPRSAPETTKSDTARFHIVAPHTLAATDAQGQQ